MSQFVKIIPDNSVKSSAVASSITSATEFKAYFVVHSVFSPRATQKVQTIIKHFNTKNSDVEYCSRLIFYEIYFQFMGDTLRSTY